MSIYLTDKVKVHPVYEPDEDRRRSASYVQSLEFGRRLHSASNLQEFVASLAKPRKSVGRVATWSNRLRTTSPRSKCWLSSPNRGREARSLNVALRRGTLPLREVDGNVVQ